MQSSTKIVRPESSGAVVWVYKKAERIVGYPEPFIRAEIKGRATAYLSFDRDGRFELSRLKVNADSPYLKVYVYRLLEKTFFDDPIPPDFRNWKDHLDISCNVSFQFVERGVEVELTHKIAGNKIYFARNHSYSHLHKLDWQLGPLHGNALVPMVNLDVLWFVKKVEEARGPQTPDDELSVYRKDPLFYD